MSIDIKDKSNKTYVILGAPGSATSFISKALEDQGIKMNNPHSGIYEPFFEDRQFVKLNTRILRRAGGSWIYPPSEEAIKAVDAKDEIIKKIARRKSKFWGFKDPRTSLTAKKYLPHLEGDVYLICCFRRPSKNLESWERSGTVKSVKDKRRLLNHINKSIISAIKEFCELGE